MQMSKCPGMSLNYAVCAIGTDVGNIDKNASE